MALEELVRRGSSKLLQHILRETKMPEQMAIISQNISFRSINVKLSVALEEKVS